MLLLLVPVNSSLKARSDSASISRSVATLAADGRVDVLGQQLEEAEE